MTNALFFTRLRATATDVCWGLDSAGCLRGWDRGSPDDAACCPITAVGNAVLGRGRYRTPDLWETAAAAMALDLDFATDVVDAADNAPTCDRALRQQLLDAVGLAERGGLLMMTYQYIGIDPGKTGAVACVSPDEACVWDTPLIGKDYDVRGMADILSKWTDATGVFACIELAQPMPREGVRASWTNGYGYGLWIGILASLAIPYAAVRPGVWKRRLGVTRDKDQTRARARELFPLVDLSLKKHHGRAEALLVSVYAKVASGGE